MQANLLAECKDAINDSDLIRSRYRCCIVNQNSVPAPRIWLRASKKNPQNHSPPSSALPACARTESMPPGSPYLLSDDEWSKRFLLLVNVSTDYDKSANEIPHNVTTQKIKLEPCVKESGRKRHSSPNLDDDKKMSSTTPSIVECSKH